MELSAERIAGLLPEQKRLWLTHGVARQRPPADVEVEAGAWQRACWEAQRGPAGAAAQNLVFGARLFGPLDYRLLRAAAQRLINRHPALRSAYSLRDPSRLIFHGACEAPLQLLDAATWREADVLREALRLARRPFDLSRAPLLRWQVLRRGSREHLLLLTVHGAVADAWSLVLMVDELCALYPALEADLEPCLAPPPAFYTDHLRRLRAGLEDADAERQWGYWRAELRAPPRPLQLAAGARDPLARRGIGNCLSWRFDPAFTAQLKTLARREGVSLHVLLLAAYALFLHRSCMQDDFFLHLPLAGRGRNEDHNVVGHFVNTLLLRSHLAGGMSFRSFVRATRAGLFGALGHQDLPGTRLLEHLHATAPGWDATRVAFLWDRLPSGREAADLFGPALAGRRLQAGSLALAAYPLPPPTEGFDLALEVKGETDGALHGALRYDVGRFGAPAMQSLLRRFAALLRAIVADPEQAAADLSMLSATEQRSLVMWNQTERVASTPALVHELVESQAHWTPEAVALECAPQTLTYKQLDVQSNQLARYLQRHGVQPGMRVAVAMQPGMRCMAVLLGLLKAGAVYVPVNRGWSRAQAARALSCSQAAYVLVDHYAAAPPSACRALHIDKDWPRITGYAMDSLRLSLAAEQPMCVLFSAGKGPVRAVQLSHQAVVNLLRACAQRPGLRATDRCLVLGDWTTQQGLLALWLPLIAGARAVVPACGLVPDPPALARALARCRPNLMLAPPAVWHGLLQTGWFGARDLTALCGGAVLPGPLARQLRSCCKAVWNLYGCAETSGWCLVHEVGASKHRSAPLGRPIANVRAYVLDRNGQPVAPGAPGILHIGGVGVVDGYLGAAESGADFIRLRDRGGRWERVFRTGDWARFGDDGELHGLQGLFVNGGQAGRAPRH